MTARGLKRLLSPARPLAARAVALAGYDLVRRDYYSPLPLAEELPSGLWNGPAALGGVELSVDGALALLEGPLAPYLAEFRPPMEPGGGAPFWLANRSYGPVDAELLYAMVRHARPARVIELGSGASSHVIALAAAANAREGAPLAHAIYDPHPFAAGMFGPVAGAAVHAVRVQDADAAPLLALERGDILFIDTTHTVRTGGEVTHLFLHILPNLRAGVTVHLHDIFLPCEYPRAWVLDLQRAWAEQYLLAAFLAFNAEFEVVMPNHALARAAPDALAAAIPSYDPRSVRPGGFWLRRRDARD